MSEPKSENTFACEIAVRAIEYKFWLLSRGYF
jgi:hypothetical protein